MNTPLKKEILTKMSYCKHCKGRGMATVRVTLTEYPNGDGWFNYKTLDCPCEPKQQMLEGLQSIKEILVS